MVNPLSARIMEIDIWLDGQVADAYKDQPLAQDWARISKVSEELGEAIQEFIGATGQNPRKGVYSDQAMVNNELADVVVTALLAIQHFTKDAEQTWQIVIDKILFLHKRALS